MDELKNQTEQFMSDSIKSPNSFDEIIKCYSKEEAVLEASRCLNCKIPNCRKGCPIEHNIPLFLLAVKEGRFSDAFDIINKKSNLSGICSIICPHEKQCSGHCVRGIKGSPVNIGGVERFVSEWAIENNLVLPSNEKQNGFKVCAVGSGPASISFAFEMVKKGYDVTIFERTNYIGGILKWGIPTFRLNSKIRDFYIENLARAGIKVITSCEIGKDKTIDELLLEFDGIFLGYGATIDKKMNIPGENLKGVVCAQDFLAKVNLNYKLEKEFKNILVIGAGNVAMDVARCAKRLKGTKSVKILYRRTEEEMPCCKEEFNAAKNEDIEFISLTNPVSFIGNDNKIEKVECAKMILGSPDESGRRRPIESNESHIFFDCDLVVLALGFDIDPYIASASNLLIDKWGCVIVDETNKTSLHNVYAGGDLVTGPQTVVLAMKAGINAATNMDLKLSTK